ncbi:MAG: terminase small subunit [Ruminococcus sp.]
MKQAGAACSAATTPDWEMWRRQHAVPAIRRSTLPQSAALLRQASCRRMVEAYRSALQGDPAAIVRAGLERLAFGRTNDVIQLLLAEEPMTGQQIQALDLFPVASLKRDKSGGMEVHFFDRLKALTTLFEKSSEADGKNAAASLLAALGGTGDADDAV